MLLLENRGRRQFRLAVQVQQHLVQHRRGSQAFSVALELWQALRSEPMEDVGIVTASFGIASWRVEEGVDGLLLRADSGVYAAKQAGRDRVEAERVLA